MDDRLNNEMVRLRRLKTILDAESDIPLRLRIEGQSLDLRQFKLIIKGIRSLVSNPDSNRNHTADVFVITVRVPSGYPWVAVPDMRFMAPVPFHPQIWPDGTICWGLGYPQPDLCVVDWVRGVVEYLQYNQDMESLLKINALSPANRAAMQWWTANANRISKYVPPVDLVRLRSLIDQTRG
ncbi:MAG: hypothetical protein NTX17_00935 [Candidatus Eisenbacteria bacterium]|nr:hypothetical protein [Candidatus Eisenbacteria bacterium]